MAGSFYKDLVLGIADGHAGNSKGRVKRSRNTSRLKDHIGAPRLDRFDVEHVTGADADQRKQPAQQFQYGFHGFAPGSLGRFDVRLGFWHASRGITANQ